MLWLGQPENQMADETIEDFTRTFLRRLDAKLDRVVERLDDLTVAVREQGQRITSLQVDIAHVPQRIDAVERRLDSLDRRADRIESRLGLIEA
jgi:hypothetical protein